MTRRASLTGILLLCASAFALLMFLAPPHSHAATESPNTSSECPPPYVTTPDKKIIGSNGRSCNKGASKCMEGKCPLSEAPKSDVKPPQQMSAEDLIKASILSRTKEPYCGPGVDDCQGTFMIDCSVAECADAVKKLNEQMKFKDPLRFLSDPDNPGKGMIMAERSTADAIQSELDKLANPSSAPMPIRAPVVPPAPGPTASPGVKPEELPLPPYVKVNPETGEIIIETTAKTPKRSKSLTPNLQNVGGLVPILPVAQQWTYTAPDLLPSSIGNLPLPSDYSNLPFSPTSFNPSPISPGGSTFPSPAPTTGPNSTSGNTQPQNPSAANPYGSGNIAEMMKSIGLDQQSMENLWKSFTGFWAEPNLSDINSTGGPDATAGLDPAPDGLTSAGSRELEDVLYNSPDALANTSRFEGGSTDGTMPGNADAGSPSDTAGSSNIPPGTNGTFDGPSEQLRNETERRLENVNQGVERISNALEASATQAELADQDILTQLQETQTELAETKARTESLQEELASANELKTRNLADIQKLNDVVASLKEATDSTGNQLLSTELSTSEKLDLVGKFLDSAGKALDVLEALENNLNSAPELPPTLLERALSGMQSMWQSFTGFVGKVYNSLIL